MTIILNVETPMHDNPHVTRDDVAQLAMRAAGELARTREMAAAWRELGDKGREGHERRQMRWLRAIIVKRANRLIAAGSAR